MKPVEVRYMRRFNLGDYEHEEIEIKIVLDEKDTATQAIFTAKKLLESTREKRKNAKQPIINNTY